MAADSKKPAAKQVNDVARPGETPPSTNSKSVIIASRPLLKAPGMALPTGDASSPEAAPAETTSAPLKRPSQPNIKPLDGSTEAAQINVRVNPKSEPPAAASPSPTPPEPKPEPPVKAVDKAPEPAPPAEPPKAAAEPEAAAPPAEPDKTETTGEDTQETKPAPDPAETDAESQAAQAKHDATIQKLIDVKQYFLPINAVEKRKTQHFVVLGIALSLLLAVAWADIALDAGLIQVNGVKPVTHFFSN